MSDTNRTATASANGSAHRSPADIERDIEVTRNRLAGTIDEIGDRVKPANVVAKVKVRARAQVIDESGAVRRDRAAGAAAAAVSALGLALLRLRRR